jgi:hypothetical protein
MRRALILGALVAALAGSACTRVNPEYCDPADDNACAPGYHCDPDLNACVPTGTPPDANHEAGGGDGGTDAGGDTAPECAQSSDCTNSDRPICADHACRACGGDPECQDRDPAKPACVSGQCLECSTSAHCSGATPLCGADQTCRACTADLECQQGPQPEVGVCVAGACPGPADVLWVDGNATCPCDGSQASPFAHVADAVTAATTGTRKIIVVRPGTYIENVVVKDDRLTGLLVVGLLGGEARIQALPSGIAVDIDLSGSVTLRRLHLRGVGATGTPTPALQCATAACTGEELEVSTAGTVGVEGSGTGPLTLRRSRVHHNIGGGIHLSNFSSYVIENNFIWQNGNPLSSLGGISFASSFGTMRFVNNTVYGNRVKTTLVGGVHCDSASVVTTNNILWENRNDSGLAETDATGGCTISYSVIDVPAIAGTNHNTGDNPQFADLLSDPIDLHLTTASGGALGGADPTQAPDDDIDGDPRPLTVGHTDIGADQRSQ